MQDKLKDLWLVTLLIFGMATGSPKALANTQFDKSIHAQIHQAENAVQGKPQ